MTKKTIAQRRVNTVEAIQDDMSRNRHMRACGADKDKIGEYIDAYVASACVDEPEEYAPPTAAQRKSLIAEAIELYEEYLEWCRS